LLVGEYRLVRFLLVLFGLDSATLADGNCHSAALRFVQELLAFQRQQKAEELENRESDAAAVATDSTGGDDSLASDREAKKDR
jgi:hypothetical protein